MTQKQLLPVNKNSLKDRVEKARKSAQFSTILNNNKSSKMFLIAGSHGKQYQTLVKLINGQAFVSKCRLTVGGQSDFDGLPVCKGNHDGVCYHTLSAMTMIAEKNGKQINFCHSEADAKRLAHLMDNALVKPLVSTDSYKNGNSGKSWRRLWVMFGDKKEK